MWLSFHITALVSKALRMNGEKMSFWFEIKKKYCAGPKNPKSFAVNACCSSKFKEKLNSEIFFSLQEKSCSQCTTIFFSLCNFVTELFY